MTATGQDFGAAALRHLDDAGYLRQASRLANADHLAGVAAECALKAIAISFLGVRSTPRAPRTPAGSHPEKELRHLPGLWAVLHLLMSGRRGSLFATQLSSANPFLSWQVDQRYEDGSRITAAVCDNHLTAARALVALHRQGQLTGALP